MANINDVLGKISPPPAIQAWGTGAAGISNLLNNIITLIYTVAAVVFVFMFLIGAIQWILSGGDKEAVSKARERIIHAIIGITLLALAFLIIKIVGTLTGFTFFKGQNDPAKPPAGAGQSCITSATCPPGYQCRYSDISDPNGYCVAK